VSQYLGDLADFETQKRFEAVLQHLLGLLEARPELVIGDLHPGYFTTELGHRLAETWQVPFVQVQHHRAHFAAVLAENELISGAEAVLGIVWDGTGYGTDGQIWGGECFVYRPEASEFMERIGHFAYFPQLLGDKMPREPRLSALAVCAGMGSATERLRPKFSDLEWDLYQKMLLQENALKTSSVGRIFDAVASLLGLADKVSFEGEAAMLLEDLGRSYCKKHGYAFETAYPIEKTPDGSNFLLQTDGLFRALLQDLDAGFPVDFIAAKFHLSMVKAIQALSNSLNINKIAFSGGVFQNTLLLDLMEHYLSPDYQLFFHRQLSPNDENISFGQWAYAAANQSIPTQKALHPN
jgi:hydrogenase maturation protein HypF